MLSLFFRESRITPLVIAAFFIMMSVIAYMMTTHDRQMGKLLQTTEQNKLASQKMQLASTLAEHARTRTRLTAEMIYQEDPFVKDELNLELDVLAARFAKSRGELMQLPLDAEDSIPNQQVAKAILERLGHAVDVAANGSEALEAIQHITYDLVLMDMQMPEMDGLEATRRIRALSLPVARVPIIAMTAHALPRDVERCIEAGMNDSVAKPVNRAKLISAVVSVLAWQSAS